MQFCVTRVILRDLAALVPQIFHSLHKITHFLTGYINSYCFVRYSREKVFRKKKSGQLQRKVEKFGQTAKIIIFVCILDHN
jgi:hypothetical protein